MMQYLNYFIYECYILWKTFALFFPYKLHKRWFFVIFSKHILNYLLYKRDLKWQDPSISMKLQAHYAPIPNSKESVGFKF